MGTQSQEAPTRAPGTWTYHPALQLKAQSLGGVRVPPAQDSIRSPSPNPQGAKFAWESAGSGLEVCPEDVYGTQEIHVNGAVALAFQLYYHSTQVRRRCARQGRPLQVWPQPPHGRDSL